MNKVIQRTLGTAAALCFVLVLAVAGQCAIVRVSTTGEDSPSHDGSTWALAKLTVQAAIDCAAPGDEIWVAEGTYVQSIALKNGIGLYGGFAGNEDVRTDRNWHVNTTKLVGSEHYFSVVTCPSGVTSATVIDGFTITGASGDGQSGYRHGIACATGSPTISNNQIRGNLGGGIRSGGGSPTICHNTISGNGHCGFGMGEPGGGISCSDGSPIISGNIISNNASKAYGGGIYCSNSSPVISDNIITGNSVAHDCYMYGGGIYCTGGSPDISGNTISGNMANGGDDGGGGGICIGGGVICNNTINGNAVVGRFSGEGGGICCWGSATISNNIIAGNSAGGTEYSMGGGIRGGNAVITNNTIVGNSVVQSSTNYGGGISHGSSLENNIIAFNSSGIRTTGSLRNNCVYNPAGSNYEGETAPGTGDISADPLFVEASSDDYHLNIISPCIDAGDNSVVQPVWTDLDGNSRVFPTGGVVDMGCYESDDFGITITSPTTSYVHSTSAPTLDVSGTTTDNIGTVTGLTWSSDRGGSGVCIGTAAWSTTGVMLQPGVNLLKVTATDDAGHTANVSLTVNCYFIPLTVSITSPTSESLYTTSSPAVALSGTAAGQLGIVSVAWSNNRGGSGACVGTASWSVSGVALQPGDNVITITATDSAANSVSATITVTRAPLSVCTARQLPSGSSAYIADAVVTATNIASGSVFVESSNRSSGIKLVTSESLSVGQSVQFAGTTGRVDGEHQISGVTFLDIASGTPIGPLTMSSKCIGNDFAENLNYVGLNTTGLLIRYAGKVTLKSTSQKFIYVDDGFGFADGLSPLFLGIRVRIPAGVAVPDKNRNVVITGISRVEKFTLPVGGGEVNGDWYPEGTTVYVPTVWARHSADVQVL